MRQTEGRRNFPRIPNQATQREIIWTHSDSRTLSIFMCQQHTGNDLYFKDLLSTWCKFRVIDSVPVLPLPHCVGWGGRARKNKKVAKLSLVCPERRELEDPYALS